MRNGRALRHQGLRAAVRRLAVVGVAAFVAVVLVPQAFAGNFIVNTSTDFNNGACGTTCSLRDAITSANGTPDADVITFDSNVSPYLIQPVSALPEILGSVTINGAGSVVRIDGTTAGTLYGLDFSGGSSLVNDVSLTKWSQGNGAGINVRSGATVTVTNSNLGTDAGATPGLGNYTGIQVGGVATIGSAGNPNVIAGNTTGIYVTGFVSIQANTIGAAGMALGNSIQGILVQSAAAGIQIGGTNSGEGNTIKGNGAGIKLDGLTTAAAIRHNGISGNAGGGIVLTNGADGNQAAPALADATSSGNSISVDGSLDGAAGTTFQVDLFTNASCSSPPQGDTFVGETSVTTDGSGHGTFSASVASGLTSGFVTATATGAPGTSTFSACTAIQTGQTFTVTTAQDLDDSGVCGATCSLRDAIKRANNSPGHDTIKFQIQGGGVPTVVVGAALPPITDPVDIDGSAGSAPGIELTPNGEVATGLDVSAGSSTVRGLIIHGFTTQIVLDTNDGNTIAGNWIGLDPDGVTSNDDTAGIQLNDSGSNTIGGTAAGDRNVITTVAGIDIGTPGNNVIEGNYVGLNVPGTEAPGVSGTGEAIKITGGTKNTVGGPGAAGNHIRCFQNCVWLVDSNQNVVAGNSIGTKADESASLPYNGDTGIRVEGTSTGNEIGGTTVADGNVVAGASGDTAVSIANGGNTIEGNFLGASRAGQPYDDTNSNGVYQYYEGVGSGSNIYKNNVIDSSNSFGMDIYDGDGTQIIGNTFHRNNDNSIRVEPGRTGITISKNAIYPDNFEDGIFLQGANPDSTQPTLGAVSINSNTLDGTVTMALDAQNALYHVEVFRTPGGCSPTAAGQTYAGTFDVTTDGNGHVAAQAFSLPLQGEGLGITATATNANSGSTSILSSCVTASDTAQSGPNFVVNTAADSADGSCGVGVCSLRDAITALNATFTSNHTITFAIGSGGTKTIQLGSALPVITKAGTTIDGTTQTGDTPTSKGIVIAGGGPFDGLVLGPGSNGSTIKGLAIQGFIDATFSVYSGIVLQSPNNVIEDNYLGTSANGATAAPNVAGIHVTSSANVIGAAGHPNVISGNNSFGVLIDGVGTTNNSVVDNLIGTDPTGNAPLKNDTSVSINGATQTTVADNVVYGDTGIEVTEPALTNDLTQITGNLVGVSKDGIATFPTGGVWGIGVDGGSGAVIQDNVIGHGEEGIAIGKTTNLTIQGNYVGVDKLGNPEPNLLDGVDVGGSKGSSTGATLTSNTVRFNPGDGIHFEGDSSLITGNAVSDNGAGSNNTASDENTGLTVNGTGNQIKSNSFFENTGPGVALESAAGPGNLISQNQIDANGGPGIDLGNDGVTNNDANGHASGPNLWENNALIANAFVAAGQVKFDAKLSSTLTGPFTIEAFWSASCAAGAPQGGQFIGTDTVPGDGTPKQIVFADPGVPVGSVITTTITDANGNTSEFSACATVASGPAGTLSGSVSNQPNANANLTAAGNVDWAAWGLSGATSLSPSVRKQGGAGISDITPNPGDPTPGGFGAFSVPAVPFGFDWSDGAPTASATGASLGISTSDVGQGFSFSVPADTAQRTLTIWASVHLASGHFAATLSDGSAPSYTYDLSGSLGEGFSPGGDNVPAVIQLTFAAASAGKHLTITWTQTGTGDPVNDDIVVYAAALSGPVTPTSADAALLSTPTVAMSGSNDALTSIPLAAFNQNVSGTSQAPNGLPLNGLPLNGLPLNGLPLNGLPLNGLPLNGLPLNGLPLNGLPLNGLPLNGLPLNGLPLNGLPLNGLNWSTLLAGTPFAKLPLQSVSLVDVMNYAKNTPTAPAALKNLTLGQLNLSGSALGQETLGALALGSAPLNGLGLPSDSILTLVDWCQSVAPTGTDCSATSLGGYSLFALGLAGAPLNGLPLNGLPLNGLPLNGLPLNGLPLNGLLLSASPLNGLPLNGLPLNGLPLNGLVSCTPGTTGCVTLGDAAASGHLNPNATVGNLLTVVLDPASPVKNTITLGDILGLLIKRNDVPWETLPPRLLSAFDPNRPTVTMTASATIHGPQGGSAPTQVTVTLPGGFDYKPGSSSTGTDPQIDTSTNTLTWTITAPFNAAQTITFQAWSGFDVGATQATATVGAGSVSDVAVAPITVNDSFAGNNSAANATTITPDQNVEMSALQTAGSVDYYKIALPAAGTRIQIHLTNLHADFDLALYANQSTTVRTGATNSLPLQDGTVPDTSVNLQGASNVQLVPTALQDIPDPGVPVVQVSANRGTDDEDVGMVSPGSGTAYVAVFGYNGASSPLPYSLRVKTIAPPTFVCPARTWPFGTGGTGGTAHTPAAISTFQANLNTLILVNTLRLGRMYGSTQENNVRTSLAHLAGDTSLGVSGAVIPVEGITGAQAQYNTWDANPCSPDAANAVANTIANYVLSVKAARPTLKYVVFAGGDDQIPFFRIPDLSLIANESGFASQFGQNEYFGALAQSDLLTDSPYLDTRPIPASGRQLFIPDLSGGRLVETGNEIVGAVTRFETSSGKLAGNTAFVSGYDFVSDSSLLIQQRLNRIFGSATTNALINNTWSKNDLLNAAFPAAGPAAINSWNGHYDDQAALAADGNQSNLVTPSDLTSGPHPLSGGIFFTMGCHAGFQANDIIVGGTTLDWAQKFAQTGTGFVGNTGFGIGNTNSVAFSEELMSDFAGNLDGSLSIGDALLQAKQDYFLSRDAFSSYDEKTLAEAELYGLPMYGINHSPAALNETRALTAAPLSLPSTDPVNGSTASTSPSNGTPGTLGSIATRSFDATPDFTFESDTRGLYYTNGGQVQAPNYRPLQPYLTMPATVSGLTAHGVIVDALTSEDDSSDHGTGSNGFDPDNVRPTVDLSANEPEPQFDDEAWPSKIPTLVSLNTASGVQQRLNLATGQFFTDTSTDPATGVERKWTHITGRVVYSTSSDFTPPTVDGIDSFIVGGNVTFTGEFSDLDQNGNAGTVNFVQVVYDVDNTGVWSAVQLQRDPSTNQWSGGAPFTGANVQYFVMACDLAGNCGYSSNKGRYFDAAPLPQQSGSLTLSSSGPSGTNPWFTGMATVTGESTNDAAITVSVDGGDFVPLPVNGITVSGDGTHVVKAKAADGSEATTVVLIDGTKPSVTIDVPASVPWGSNVPVNFTCVDRGSGVTSCDAAQNNNPVANGGALNTANVGPVTIKVDSDDAAGNTVEVLKTVQIVKATPTVDWPSPASMLFGTPLSATQLNATASVPGTFSYMPAAGTVLQPGNQTLTAVFTPTDGAHYAQVTTTRTISVVFSSACQTGGVSKSLTIQAGTAYCINGGSVRGSITVLAGASLWMTNGKVSGSLTATRAGALTICGSSISGSLTTGSATGPVIVGAASGCTKNAITGSVTLTSNTKGVTLLGNAISGSVTASSNGGGTVVSDNVVSQSVTVSSNTGGITVTNDKISRSLTVTNNRDGFSISNNTVGGSTTIIGNS